MVCQGRIMFAENDKETDAASFASIVDYKFIH